jgi:tetratricopeptide (TPR) repeat protein
MAVFREQLANEKAKTADERVQLREEARAMYQRALTDDPNFLAAHIGLARHWAQENHLENALACYDAALRLAPRDAALWFEVGTCLARRQQWEPALARLRKAAEISPANRQYVSSYAIALVQVNRADEGLAWLTKIYPPAEAHFNLARVLHQLRKDDLARTHLQQALEANPSLAAARQLLAELDRAVPAQPAE